MNFKNLHNQDKPLFIANVWDVASTKVAEKLNFKAVATSSSAIADILGYKDGEGMELSDLEYFVKRIVANTTLPVSVDLESGFSRNAREIANNIKRFADLGVVGINIEDSLVEEDRTLIDGDKFAKTLKEVKGFLDSENVDVFINVRTDTFILLKEDVVAETKKRIRLYEDAGVDGIFTPAISNESDIKEIVEFTDLPVNVMAVPNLPGFDTLANLGVRRISMGNFVFDNMYVQLEDTIKGISSDKSFKSIF